MQLNRPVIINNLIWTKIYTSAATCTQSFIQYVFFLKFLTSCFGFRTHSLYRSLKSELLYPIVIYEARKWYGLVENILVINYANLLEQFSFFDNRQINLFFYKYLIEVDIRFFLYYEARDKINYGPQ